MKTICYLLAIALSLNLVSCGKIDLGWGLEGFSVSDFKNVTFDNATGYLSEVAPPNVIQKLSQSLDLDRPQVTILSPKSEAILEDTTLEVRLAVDNLTIFKDDRLEMGNHLYLILDNEPYGEIYNLEEPIFLTDLKPGTHSLRVLAEKPWHESFKNSEAYDGVTFSVLTETETNQIDRDTPLLTYNQPNGVYTAEPILLDFYLSNVDRDNWQVEAKVNDEVFTIDEWQPIYLTGLIPGNNLIELELQDKAGKPIENSFNKTIRLISYQGETGKQDEDTLALLMKDRIDVEDAVAIVDPNYYIQPVGEPEIKEIETIKEDLPAISQPVEEDLKALGSEDAEESLIEESETIPEDRGILEESELESVPAEMELDVELTEEVQKSVEEESIEEIDSATTEFLSEEMPSEMEIKPEAVIKNENISLPAIPKEEAVSTTSVKQETPSVGTNRQLLLEEGLTEIPVEERVVTEEKTEIENITEETESDSTEVNIPQSKLQVPQWWQKLVVKLQYFKEKIVSRVSS